MSTPQRKIANLASFFDMILATLLVILGLTVLIVVFLAVYWTDKK